MFRIGSNKSKIIVKRGWVQNYSNLVQYFRIRVKFKCCLAENSKQNGKGLKFAPKTVQHFLNSVQ